MITVYLAGPMDQVSKDRSILWRERVHEYFSFNDGIKILDPTRRNHEDEMTSMEIYLSDLKDVRDCDVMLADSRDGQFQFGTPCEIFYCAHVLSKPVLAWFDEENNPLHKRRIFQEALFTNEFDSLEAAMQHIEGYYVGTYDAERT